jgi:hypothetical protein
VGSPLLFRLRGNQWEGLSPGLSVSGAYSMAVFDDRGAHRPALWLMGSFTSAGGVPSQGIARLDGCAGTCYANCDGSTTPPVLNVLDFGCFLSYFAAQMPQANCDGSTTPPVLNVLDFVCFLYRFAAGCP